MKNKTKPTVKGLNVRNTGRSLVRVTTCASRGQLLMCPLVDSREYSLSSLRQYYKSEFDPFGKSHFNGKT